MSAFSSLLVTLTANDQDPHDLLDAYHTLSHRLRCFLHNDRGDVLGPLRSTIDSLKRDINPPDDLKRATDSVAVCHAALQFVSLLFRFESLYRLFSVTDLQSLFSTVLSLSQTLPTPYSTKTHALVVWILQSQRLPPHVLFGDGAVDDNIVYILKTLLGTGASDGVQKKMVTNALKATKSLLTAHPSFLSVISDKLLPHVLEHLLSSSPEGEYWKVRHIAADVLGTVCTLLIKCDDDDAGAWCSCAQHVRAFIDAQCSQSQRATGPKETRLQHVLSVSLSVHPTSNSAAWSTHTLLTLFILSSNPPYSPFTHPRSIKLFVTLFGEALNNRHNNKSARRNLRRAGEHGWAGLVWALERLGLCAGGGDEVEGAGGGDVQERAFRVVKQELGGGLGAALFRALLNSGSDSETDEQAQIRIEADVSRALVVLGDMIHHPRRSVMRAGVGLLRGVLGGIGNSSSLSISYTPTHPLAMPIMHALFDGTALRGGLSVLGDEGGGGGATNEEMGVRLLTEGEVGRWWEALMGVWREGVGRYLSEASDPEDVDRKTLCNDLIQIWQSLLLVQAQLTQGHAHLTTHTEFANRTAKIIDGFLVPHSPSTSPQPPALDANAHLNHLTFTARLWRVTKNVFAPAWLPGPAAHVLNKLMRINCVWGDEGEFAGVQRAWRGLCAELVGAVVGGGGGAGLLDVLGGENGVGVGGDGRLDIVVMRELWGMLGSAWNGSEDVHWEQAVRFLGVPFGSWVMNDNEIELWETMLRRAIVAAESVSTTPALVVIEVVLHRLGEWKVDRSSRLIEVICILLSHLNLLTITTTLPTELFMMFDEILQNLYPPLHLQDIDSSLRFLCTLKAVIIATPSSLLLPLVTAVQNGLCVWIEDRKELVPELEYNDAIMSLYIDTLSKLRTLPPSTQFLQTLTPFLASSFVRIPPPALGPLAFQTFWKETYHAKQEFLPHVPPRLRVCVKAFDDAYGTDLAAGLGHDTESQLVFGSSAPDSEPQRITNNLVCRPLGPGSRHNSARDISAHPDSVFEGAIFSSSPISFRHEAAVDSLSILHGPEALMPPASHPVSERIPPTSALSQLKDYSNRVAGSINELSPPLRSRSLASLNRRHDDGLDSDEISLKRTRTDPDTPSLNETRRDLPTGSVTQRMRPKRSDAKIKNIRQAPTRAIRTKLTSFSESTSRVLSPIVDTRYTSELILPRKRMKFDGVEVPTYQQILRHERRRTSVVVRDYAVRRTSPELSDDFDKWEANLDISDLRSVPPRDVSVPDTEICDTSDAELQHSPLRKARATSARLDLLHEAYAVVSNDASQMQVHDLVNATRLVHRIGYVLSDHMGRRLGRTQGHQTGL